METLHDLHTRFREQDRRERAFRRRKYLARVAGVPEAQRECLKAIRCDPRETGLCRWCERRCEEPVPRPHPPYDENQGDVLKGEAYDYHWGNDEADLPYWYWGAGTEIR